MEMSAVRRWAGRHPLLTDAVLVGVACGLTVLAFVRGSEVASDGVTGWAVCYSLVATLPLPARRWAPLPMLGFVTLVCGLEQSMHGPVTPIFVPMATALYTMAVRTERRVAWIAAAVAAFCLAVPIALTAPGPLFGPFRIGTLTWICAATALGDSVRTRRAYVAQLEERALRAERTREEEAARRVGEERLRIARELHDVVAHELTLINAQAGVTVHLGQRDPGVLVDVLAGIRERSRESLDELRAIVGLLAQPGDARMPREPVPGLHQLDDLVDSFARAGLHVDVERDGERRDLPSAVDVAGYRIVQEALTNVRKHAAVTHARVRLGFGADALRVSVENDASEVGRVGAAANGTGRGLISIRERAAAVGGQASAGPRIAGGYVVEARLPFVRSAREMVQIEGAA